jgi:hypothetical protein
LCGQYSAYGARQLFDQLVSIARGEQWAPDEGGRDTPARGYDLRGKPVTKSAVMIAANLAAEACLTLLVEFPAHRLEDRHARLSLLTGDGCWRVPGPWRRKAFARAQSDLRMLMGG